MSEYLNRRADRIEQVIDPAPRPPSMEEMFVNSEAQVMALLRHRRDIREPMPDFDLEPQKTNPAAIRFFVYHGVDGDHLVQIPEKVSEADWMALQGGRT